MVAIYLRNRGTPLPNWSPDELSVAYARLLWFFTVLNSAEVLLVLCVQHFVKAELAVAEEMLRTAENGFLPFATRFFLENIISGPTTLEFVDVRNTDRPADEHSWKVT